jgi:hypothetical protein
MAGSSTIIPRVVVGSRSRMRAWLWGDEEGDRAKIAKRGAGARVTEAVKYAFGFGARCDHLKSHSAPHRESNSIAPSHKAPVAQCLR